MPDIISVSQDTLDRDVLKSGSVVLLDLWAPWCGPCKSLAPVLEKLAAESGETLTIAKLDVDENPQVMNQFSVRGIPTMLLFKDGKEIGRQVGTKTLGQLKNWLSQANVLPDVQEPQPLVTTTYSAFYGDDELKEFYRDRLLGHAQRGELFFSYGSTWDESGGTPSAAIVRSSDPVIFERQTGLTGSFANLIDFLAFTDPADITLLFDAIRSGADVHRYPLDVIQNFIQETQFGWQDLLSRSRGLDTLRLEWLTLRERELAGEVVPAKHYHDLASRAQNDVNSPDRTGIIFTDLLRLLSPPPAPGALDEWAQIFTTAGYMALQIAQHVAGWTYEDRHTDERRHTWFTEKEKQSINGTFSAEELEAHQALWFSENEAYQRMEDQFFDKGLQGMTPILGRMRKHLIEQLIIATKSGKA